MYTPNLDQLMKLTLEAERKADDPVIISFVKEFASARKLIKRSFDMSKISIEFIEWFHQEYPDQSNLFPKGDQLAMTTLEIAFGDWNSDWHYNRDYVYFPVEN